MAEFSKFMKIVLSINIFAAFIYGILYLFIPEFYSSLVDAPNYNPLFFRLWGATCTSLGIVGILAFLRNNWEQFKILFEFVILWLIIQDIVNLTSFSYLARSPTNIASQWTDIIIIILLIIIDIYAYLKENKNE
ncbi:MAG: hypothetical protein ACTSRH_02690 [Promethearchaeota archaeon]